MRKLWLLPLLVAVLFGFTTVPVQADISGYMNSDEYNWVHTGANQDTRAEVADHCDCSGVRIWTGSRFDNDAIGIRYETPSGADAYVYYVLRDKWYAYSKNWCNDSGCYEGDV